MQGESSRRLLVAWHVGCAMARVAPENLDATVVLWSLCRTIDVEQLHENRMVVRFDLTDGRWPRLWIVAQKPEAELLRARSRLRR